MSIINRNIIILNRLLEDCSNRIKNNVSLAMASHIFLNRKEISNIPFFVHNGTDDIAGPVIVTILSPVLKYSSPCLTCIYSIPEYLIFFQWCLTTLEYPRLLTNSIFGRIACYLFKLGIDIFDNPIRICYEYKIHTLFDDH